jgi:hypothetical protein
MSLNYKLYIYCLPGTALRLFAKIRVYQEAMEYAVREHEPATQKNQAENFTIIGPAEVWQGIVESRKLVIAVLLVSLIVGLMAAYLPQEKYRVTAGLMPADVADVQAFRAQFNYHGAVAPAYMIQNMPRT